MTGRLVVIGGVAAGMSAASQAKRRSPDTEVIVLEAGKDVSYGACGMPYNVADPDRDPDDLVVITAQRFRNERGIDLRLRHKVEAIDTSAKKVHGTSGRGRFEIDYDKLIIATGARALVPEVPGISLDNVQAFHTLEDTRKLKAALSNLESGAKVVIAGAGYVGLELAEALRVRGFEVALTKRKPKLLPWINQDMEKRLLNELETNGVKLVTGAGLEEISKLGDRLSVKAGGHTLEADLVLIATGVVPNTEIAKSAGLELGPHSEIKVDAKLNTSTEDVLAAGDCADAFHVVTGERVWIPLALRANRAGKIAGANAVGADLSAPPVAGTQVFKLFSLQVAKSGLSVGEASLAGFEPVSALIHASTRAHAFPGAKKMSVELVADKRTAKLLGGQIVAPEGAAHRINTIAAALAAGMTVRDFAGLDLAYAPPFGPTWDPMLVAANQLVKKVEVK